MNSTYEHLFVYQSLCFMLFYFDPTADEIAHILFLDAPQIYSYIVQLSYDLKL